MPEPTKPLRVVQTDTDGNAVPEAGVGQSFNREASAAQITALGSGAIKFTWVDGSRPTAIELKVITGAAWVVFDAPDDATADAWLLGASGESTDSQRYLANEYLPEETAGAAPSKEGWTKSFTDGLANMYLKTHTTTPSAVSVEAS